LDVNEADKQRGEYHMITRHAVAIPALLLMAVFAGCEIDTKVRVTTDNPPKFIFSGNGILAQIYVSGPFTLDELKLIAEDKVLTKEEALKIKQVIGDNRILWQIDPGTGKYISDLPVVIYGEVPKDFKQVHPKNNIKPPSLLEGKYYSIYPPSHNANYRMTYFVVRNGKIFEISTEEILKPDTGRQ
jgi:hypothetical protein